MGTFYTVEIDIKELDERLIKCMKAVARKHSCDVHNYFGDNLVIVNNKFDAFISMLDELNTLCKMFNVEYTSLLVY